MAVASASAVAAALAGALAGVLGVAADWLVAVDRGATTLATGGFGALGAEAQPAMADKHATASNPVTTTMGRELTLITGSGQALTRPIVGAAGLFGWRIRWRRKSLAQEFLAVVQHLGAGV